MRNEEIYHGVSRKGEGKNLIFTPCSSVYSVVKNFFSFSSFAFSALRTAGTMRLCVRSFRVILFSLLFIGCDLFTGPKVDLLQKIDDEVAWANAAKLSVRIEFPAEWGYSNPPAGAINMDIRKGYAFEIEFTPDIAYGLNGWRAFRTDTVPANWTEDLEALESAHELFIDDVERPLSPDSRGGKASFKINSADRVTLVPWCKTEPRVTRTEPRLAAVSGEGAVTGNIIVLPRAATITIHFNSPISEASLLNNIMIGTSIGGAGSDDHYPASTGTPRYTVELVNQPGVNAIALIPLTANPPDENKQLYVRLEKEIKNLMNEGMARPVTFTWKTMAAGDLPSVTAWSAVYNANNTITISNITLDKPGSPSASYSVNQGVNTPLHLTLSGGTYSATINGVSPVSAGGVRSGNAVNNLREYEITINVHSTDLQPGTGVKFKIWNVPGMVVSNANPLTEVSTAAGLAAVTGSGQYVLMNDISITGHTPIAGFSGMFYGNGHTVTINSFFAGATDIGIFGVVNNAAIRDLTVQYNTVNFTGPASESHFGGIAGQTTGSVVMLNTLSKGSVSFASSGTNVYAGGIIGSMAGSTKIENSYSSLNLTVNSGANNSTYIGGLTGRIDGTAAVTDLNVIGTVTLNTSNNSVVYLGGICGYSNTTGKFTDCEFNGNINLSSSSNREINMGGFAGYAVNAEFVRCSSKAENIRGTFNKTGNGIYFGGFLGMTPTAGSGSLKFDSCFSTSSVYIESSNITGIIYGGGFVGRLGFSNPTVNACYATGSIYVKGNTASGDNPLLAGGFVGYVGPGTVFNDCYALGNVVAENMSSTSVSVGGFVGNSRNTGSYFNYCFSLGSVTGSNAASGIVNAGGFCGLMDMNGGPSRINNCAALGDSVTARSNDNDKLNVTRIYNAEFENKGNNNYAIDTMRIGKGAYGTLSITPEHPSSDIGSSYNGISVSDFTFRDPRFWQTTLLFDTLKWNFNTVASRGYPILRGVGGQ